MNDKSVKAILFDWDMTLAFPISPKLTHTDRLIQLFQEHGVAKDADQILTALKTLNAEIEAGQINGVTRPQKRREIITQYRQLLSRLNYPDTSYEFSYKIYSGYALLPQHLYEDVIPTLETLKTAGYALGVLSNHSRSVRPIIEQMLKGYVAPEAITISEEIGRHKPAKSSFHRAASRMRVPASRTAYVGDNLTVDALGSVRNGEYALGVWLDRHGQAECEEMPLQVRCITSLKELPDLL